MKYRKALSGICG